MYHHHSVTDTHLNAFYSIIFDLYFSLFWKPSLWYFWRLPFENGKFLILVKVKVKVSRYRPGVAQRVGSGIALLFHDRGTRRGWVVSSTSRPHFTPGKDPVPIVHEAGWAPGMVWTPENLVHTGTRSRTVQPVVSRYTDWATGPKLEKERNEFKLHP